MKRQLRNRWAVVWEHLAHPRMIGWALANRYHVTAFYETMAEIDPTVDDLSRPQWLNFGYWKDETRFNDACAALARKLGKIADLNPNDKVLDVGFGFGEQDLFWVKEFDVESISGINVTQVHVDVARERIKRAGLSERIDLGLGSATQLPFPDDSFDKVVALECAFHFDTREDFFAEASRVLKPGGRLALADCLPREGRKRDFWLKLNSKKMCIPIANQYDRHAYVKKLEKHGFGSVQSIPISDWVWPAMVSYFEQVVRGGLNRQDFVFDIQKDNPGLDAWYENDGWFVTLDDYLLFSGDKPA